MALCKIRPDFPVLKEKDINVVRSLIKDASWIIAAVDNLRVVEKVLKEEEFEEHKSSNSINNIISCLQTLDNCRLKLHEELEIQSIRGFIMRQTYLNLPKQIRAMIEVAVRSAKNEAEQHYRKDQNETDTLNADLERMRHEILKLEAENYYLPLKQKEIEYEESEVIDEFNLRLQHKLELKEKLRKLREKIREENQNIVYTEAAILKMKDDLIVQRAKAQKEMEFYLSEIEEVKKRRDMWLEKVNTVKPEYTIIMTNLKSSDKIIDDLKSNMKTEGHKMTTSSRLKGTYQKKMKQEKKMLDTLFERKNRNLEKLSNLKMEFEYDLSQKTQSNHELEMRIIFEKSHLKELEESEKELVKVLSFFREIEESCHKNWKTHKEKLDALQEQFCRLEKELFEIMNEQTQMKDTTELVDNLLQKRLTEMKIHIKTLIDTLNLKKKVRIEIEEFEENIHRSLEQVKEERDNYEVETKKLIKQLEEEYKQKLNEVKQLQKDIRDTVKIIKYEVGELKLIHDKHEEECIKKEDLIKEIEDKADEQEKILKEINVKYEELTNPFKELAFEYHNRLKEYTSIYRRHSYDKFQLNDLMTSTSKSEKELLKQQKKKGKLERSIKRLNEKYLNSVNKNNEEAEEIEGEIYMHVCRLKFLKSENQILTQEIKNHEQKSEEIDEFNKDQSNLQTLLKQLIKRLKRGFMKKQRKMDEMGELALERDTSFLDQFRDILDVINYNIKLVTSILDKIGEEMNMFKAKWGNLKNMRPHQESGDNLP